jgi:hypothetical protein
MPQLHFSYVMIMVMLLLMMVMMMMMTIYVMGFALCRLRVGDNHSNKLNELNY